MDHGRTSSALYGTTLGILGGGQLGRMLAIAGVPLGLRVRVLDPAEMPPAAAVCEHTRGSFQDADEIERFARTVDQVTVEIEHVSVEGLKHAESIGLPVHPSSSVVSIVQDKLEQKLRLSRSGLPVADFQPLSGGSDNVQTGVLEFGLPAVQKLRFGGYDGRGVLVIRNRRELTERRITGDAYVERYVDRACELSVVVARSTTGEIAAYPPFEMVFDNALNLVDHVVYPAAVDNGVMTKAVDIAKAAAEAVEVFGIVAVELFVTPIGDVLINEIAPRPHNSGHLTIEASETSQYEQHLRAIFGLPLGSTRMKSCAVMKNIIGRDPPGTTDVTGIDAVLKIPGVHLHLYGKTESRPGRKMGHVTACGSDLKEILRNANDAVESICVSGAADRSFMANTAEERST